MIIIKQAKKLTLVTIGFLFAVFQSCEQKADQIWNVDVATQSENIKTAYLYEVNAERVKTLIDSAIVIDKNFHLGGKNKQEALGVYYLDFDKSQKGGITFLISNGDELKIDLSEAFKSNFEGNEIANDFNTYNAFKQKEIDFLVELSSIFTNPEISPDEMESKMAAYRANAEQSEKDKLNFIGSITNPELNSYLVLEEILTSSVIEKDVFEKFIGALSAQGKLTERGKKAIMILDLFDAYKLSHEISFLDFNTAKQEYDKLNEANKNSGYGKMVLDNLTDLEKLGLGQLPPPLTATTLNKEAFDLNQVKEKIVLIDFWASWCGPCRLENPNYKRLYDNYKNSGFNIVGYSLDTDEAKWRDAVKKDKLDWINVSNLKKQSEDLVLKAYQVSGIPANILLIDGKIAARNLFGPELEDFLAKNQ